VVNVKSFGAKGDYQQQQGQTIGTGTDDSEAFRRAIEFIVSQTIRFNQYNEQAVRYVLYIPAGRYLIRQPEALLPGSIGLPVKAGLIVQGAGNPTTEIIYHPTVPDTYLLNNNNAFQWLTFRDIRFTSVGKYTGSLRNGFMRSYSLGQAQNYYFERVNWGGGWKEVLRLVGNNTNSEMTWMHCGFQDQFENAIHIPYTPGDPVNSGNDQMVNYNFFATQFEVSRGNYLNLQKGGSVNIWGGSLMYVGNGTGTDTNGTFFILGNETHNLGACRFHLEGVRMELIHPTAKLIQCDWNMGTIEFINLDQSVQSYMPNINVVNAVFNLRNNAGPVISWINCSLQGKHQYVFGGNAFARTSRIRYEGCEIMNNDEAKDFVEIVQTGGNRGGTPVITFSNCRSNNGGLGGNWNRVFDCSLGWHQSARGETEKRVVKLTNADNALGTRTAPADVYLPLNCLITKIIFNVPRGATTSTTPGWQFFVQTSEATPTTLATAAPIGNLPSNGINVAVDVNFLCDTDAKRHIVATSNAAVNAAVRGICAIEYIG
jgi:hypothetical protein